MPARILVLDEDPDMCQHYRTILEHEGYTVLIQPALPDIEAVRALQPDLILLDYFQGPTPRGWIFIIQLKTYVETEQIPVVLCTKDITSVAAHAHDLATFNINVIPKPFSVSDFTATIRYSYPLHERGKHV
jgi:DNA-binding response OmpR family regulator